jgi:drug/metabolite transporter (DMT)-like permease
MKNNRESEKRGWRLGWLCGFIWVLVLAIANLVKGDLPAALIGFVLSVIAVAVILLFPPWRYPTVSYWKIMLPIYLVFFLSVVWVIWTSGGVSEAGLSGWSLFLLLPILSPMFLIGRRRWNDGNQKNQLT